MSCLIILTGTLVDVSTIMRFVHDSGFTRQKMIIRATQQSAILRAQYLSDMTVYNGHPDVPRVEALVRQMKDA